MKIKCFGSCLFLCILLLLSLMVPVFADGGSLVPSSNGTLAVGNNGQIGTYWDRALDQYGSDIVDYITSRSRLEDGGCPNSPDGYHKWTGELFNDAIMAVGSGHLETHCYYCNVGFNSYVGHNHNWVKQGFGTDSGRKFTAYRCSVCGQFDRVYDDNVTGLYDESVDALPHEHIDSSGGFYWTPTHDDCTAEAAYGSSVGYSYKQYYVNVVSSGLEYFVAVDNYSKAADYTCLAPVAGFYTCVGNLAASHFRDGVSETINYDRSSYTVASGQAIRIYTVHKRQTGTFIGYSYFPTFRVLPSVMLDVGSSGTTYNIDSRPTSISGDLAYYDVSGALTLAPSTSIVNESDNSVYNPVTQDSHEITSWDYDYSSRTYNMTYEDDNSQTQNMTVTYGDENITINDAGTTYTVYYVTNAIPESEHIHDYAETVTLAPTCTTAGTKRGVCSICNDTYTETVPALGHAWNNGTVLKNPTCTTTGTTQYFCSRCETIENRTTPALGHDWHIKTQVQTQYNEDGTLSQQGYTIYQCSRCGAEYKSDDDINPAPPPNPSPAPGGDGGDGGDGGGGSLTPSTDTDIELPSGASEFFARIIAFFKQLPETLSEMTAFLRSAFSYIPDSVMYFIEFGVAMAVLLGIFKLMFR